MRKYYEAYNDRYLQVHTQGLAWFSQEPSPIVMEVISQFGIQSNMKLLEIGCGEGRDAKFLLNSGFDLLATDISPEAIAFCQNKMPDFKNHFAVLDCLKDQLDDKFDFIYAVAVIHMLVLEEDRKKFYQFIRSHLAQGGVALICTMGDGCTERMSDISTAFSLQEREHEETGKKLYIAGTSYRGVSFETFDREINENGLQILQQGLTDIQPDYWNIMYAVVKKR